MASKLDRYSVVIVLGGLIVVSKLSGFVRDLLLTYFFGVSAVSDSYFLAATASSLIFIGLYGAIPLVVVPIYSKLYGRSQPQDGLERELQAAFDYFLVASLLIACLAWLCAEPLMTWVVGDGSPARADLSARYLRVMSLSYALSAAVAFLVATLSVEGRPIHAYWVPVVTNAFFCLGALVFGAEQDLVAILMVAQLGWVILAAQAIFFARHGSKIIMKRRQGSLGHLASIFRSASPAAASLYVEQGALLISTYLAAQMITGSVSIYNYASKLNLLFLSVFAVVLTTSLFPRLAIIAQNEDRSVLVKPLVSWCRYSFLLSVPLVVFLALGAENFVSLVYKRGQFSTADVIEVSKSFGWLVLSLPFALSREILNRALFSLGMARVALMISVMSALLFLAFAALVFPARAVEGLALSWLLVTVFQFLITCVALQSRMSINMLHPILKAAVSACVFAGVAALFIHILGGIKVYSWAWHLLAYLSCYVIALWLLRNPECRVLARVVVNKMKR